MKIIKLISDNFKRLVAVEIEPSEDGGLVLVTGKNGMGKSSVLDAIMTTLAGGKTVPDKPIRDGQDEATNTIITENYTITRTFNEKGSKLVIKNAEGFAASSPQKLLDKIVGDLTFDPMKFIQMGDTEAGKRQQRLALMTLAGLDFADIDAKISNTKTERADIRRDKERYEHEAERILVMEFCPAEEVPIAELLEELSQANAQNKKSDDVREYIKTEIGNIEAFKSDVANTNRRIEQLEKEMILAKKCRDDYDTELDTCRKSKEQLEKQLAELDEIDIDVIQTKMTDLEITNGEVRKAIQRTELEKQAEAKAAEYQALGKEMKGFEQQKATRLADAKMPLEGLSVTDDYVVFEGIPLSQVNTAKQLEVGLEIAMAQNPELKVILMSGNALDDDNLAVIDKRTKGRGFQVWVERIEGEGGIVIEDGMVKGGAK
jgi:DNA repair exonuclease SbcCD ATPase subunit